MLHNTADKIICFFAQSIPAFGIVENIFPVAGQRHVQMYAAACHIRLGLGHKARKQSVTLRNGLDRQLERHKIVCDRQCLLVFKVYLVLSGCHLVMGCLDLATHILHRENDVTPCILTGIIRS